MHLDNREAGEKLARLQHYLTQDPENPHLLLELLDLSQSLGQTALARQYLASARKLWPQDVAFAQREGHLLLDEQEWLAASAVFEQLYRQHPDPALAFNLAFAWFWLGQYAGAREVLQPYVSGPHATQDVPAAVPLASVILLLRCLHHLGDLPAAMTLLQAHLPRFAGEPELLSVASLLYLDNNQLDLAEQAARAALVADPAPFEALVVSGNVALGYGDYALAAQQFAAAVQRKPDDGRSMAGCGLVSLLQHDYARAAKELEQAIASMPGHIGTRHILAWCKILAGDLPGAQAVLQAALALDRNFGETHGGLAVVAAMQGRRSDAETAIRRAQGLNPNGLSAAFAQMLLQRDAHDPAKFVAEVHALMAQQQAPFGGSLADLLMKMQPEQGKRG